MYCTVPKYEGGALSVKVPYNSYAACAIYPKGEVSGNVGMFRARAGGHVRARLCTISFPEPILLPGNVSANDRAPIERLRKMC